MLVVLTTVSKSGEAATLSNLHLALMLLVPAHVYRPTHCTTQVDAIMFGTPECAATLHHWGAAIVEHLRNQDTLNTFHQFEQYEHHTSALE